MKKISVLGLVLLALMSVAATIQWYSQQPATTALADNMVIAVERPVPHGYLSTTLASLKGYTGTNTIFVSSNVFTTNLFSTNVYTTNLYSSNAFVTNITVNNITSQTNYFTTLTVESNVMFNGKVTINNITVTNGITNLNLTANTIVQADANSALASVPNGTGSLTNDGAGNFGWAASTGGDQVWTNDGTWIWPRGEIDPNLGTGPGPYTAFYTNGSHFIGRNSYIFDTADPDYAGTYAVSVVSSNDPSFLRWSAMVIGNGDYAWESDASITARARMAPGTNGNAGAVLNLYTSTLNGNTAQFAVQLDPDNASSTKTYIKFLSGTEVPFYANSTAVTSTVPMVAKAFLAREQSWSGPTNEISVGEWIYTAHTPCSVTNIVEFAAGVGNGALLSITNASSSNITFTVHSPIQIPYGETSRSYTITNGNTFFGSFRKGAHGSVFVPRGFYNP